MIPKTKMNYRRSTNKNALLILGIILITLTTSCNTPEEKSTSLKKANYSERVGRKVTDPLLR